MTSYERLVRTMYLLARDHHEAEDLAEEAMARTYERWGRVRRMEAPVAYLYRIAVNLHRRRQRRFLQLVRDVLPRVSSSEDTSRAETATEVRMALRSLRPELRTVLILIEWLGMTSEEVGSVVGLRPSSVRSRLLRARAAFKEAMRGSDD
jgi:RNA polymerase sigma factor (sigma-70 family)